MLSNFVQAPKRRLWTQCLLGHGPACVLADPRGRVVQQALRRAGLIGAPASRVCHQVDEVRPIAALVVVLARRRDLRSFVS